jgi:hypothetical protein
MSQNSTSVTDTSATVVPVSYVYKRRRFRQLRWLAVALCIGLFPVTCTAVVLHELRTGFGATDEPEAFLDDVRDVRYGAAYDRLCHASSYNETRPEFVTRMTEARRAGRGVRSFRLTANVDRETLAFSRISGTVTLADGSREEVNFDLSRQAGSSCLVGLF